MIGGDKTGRYTKIHGKVFAPGIFSPAYNIHMLAIFQALYSHQNILKVLEPFEKQIKYMQHKDFTLPGKSQIEVLLNGDFKMLDLIMSHQSHMKTHGGTPLTPENWFIELTEISDFMESFVATVIDDRAGAVSRKGKNHSNITGSPLVAIISLSNIILQVLRITLGIVFTLFEMV